MKLDTIESAIEDIRQGKVIIVVDDEDRENEGDFVTAAESVTPEIINFMATHGRGLICAPLVESRCDELGLEMMVNTNTAVYETAFTVSVDLIGHGCTTGISASDRAKTIRALIDDSIQPEELGKPGHIFPLRAKEGGVLRRMGHTEATIDLARLAGLKPAGVLVEIMNEDGTMARLPELMEIARRFDLKIVSIADLIAYRLENESLIQEKTTVTVDTKYGPFLLKAFEQTTTGDVHLALVKGEWDADETIPVRVHSSTLANDLHTILDDSYSPGLHDVIEIISTQGKGVIVIMNQQNKDLNLINTLDAISRSSGKLEGIQLRMDSRDYGIGAQILRALGIRKMALITNNPNAKHINLGFGLEIAEVLSVKTTTTVS